MVNPYVARAVASLRSSSIETLEPRQLYTAVPVAHNGADVLAESGEWIIAPAHKVKEARLDRLLSKQGGSVNSSLGIGGEYLISVPGSVTQESLAKSLRSLGKTTQIVPNLVITAAATTNDPYASSQYFLGGTGTGKINTAEAWDVSKGDGVVVAVLDTGVELNHPDLINNIWTNPNEIDGDGIDNDANGYVDDIHGWDFANNDNNPSDDNGHGTHVAGLVAASTNNALGVSGVGYNADILPLKFLRDTGSGSLSNAVSALNYAAMMKTQEGVNIRVVNNSWGGSGTISQLQNAFTTLQNAGILAVVAAGNGGSDQIGDNNDVTANYPSNYNNPNIITVAATDSADRLASFSNYGATSVDLGAPGVSDLSTTRGGGYGYMSGTSMASPVVAGAAAVLFAAKPNATYSEVKAALMNNVDPVASLAGKTVSGGRLNVGKAVKALATTPVVTAPAAPASASATATASSVNVTWTDSATNETGYKVFRATGSGAFTQVATLAEGTTAYTDTAVTAGTTYSYRIRATNTAGDSADSPTATATVPQPRPNPASNVTAAVNGAAINLAWTDNSNNETGFKVFRTPTGGTATLLTTLAAGVTTYTDSAPIAGTTYTYSVVPTNSAGDAAAATSNAVTVPVTPTLPAAPTNLRATYSIRSYYTAYVTLTWTDAATNETGYQIFRASAGTTPSFIGSINTANATSFTDYGASVGRTYTYYVRAINSAGASAAPSVTVAPVIISSGSKTASVTNTSAQPSSPATKLSPFSATSVLFADA